MLERVREECANHEAYIHAALQHFKKKMLQCGIFLNQFDFIETIQACFLRSATT
jgi:hypothetical protein